MMFTMCTLMASSMSTLWIQVPAGTSPNLDYGNGVDAYYVLPDGAVGGSYSGVWVSCGNKKIGILIEYT